MGCATYFEKLYQFERKRLILVLGIVFFVILVLQSSSLPYGNVLLLSLLSFKSPAVGNSTLVHNLNSTDSVVVVGVVNKTEGIDVRNERRSESERDAVVDNAEYAYSENGLEKDGKSGQGLSDENSGEKSDSSSNVSSGKTGFVAQPLASPPVSGITNLKTDESANPQLSSLGKEAAETPQKAGDLVPLLNNLVNSTRSTTMIADAFAKKKRLVPTTPISEMNKVLVQSRASSRAMRPRWSSIRDQELLHVKSQIENAPIVKSDRELYAPLYRNISMFKRSYELMETTFKVYIYSEGDKPVFHQPKLKGIYASEGWFMKLIEGSKQFVVTDPTKAHMFYLPFSALMLRSTLNVNSQKHKNLADVLKNYVNLIAGKYRFWNRTGGADHFLVACHDWAPQETIRYMGTCIRALCNANVARGFNLGKDVSSPVTMVRFADDPLQSLGGKPPSKRPFLTFFAGSMHGYVRPFLLQYWENKDPDMKIFGPLPSSEKLNYIQYMKRSKYCICARGYEVHTPRVVEAIFHECVPVIISDNYVPPFFNVFNWEAFSVFILEKDIPNLKKILLSIPKKNYLELQKRVKKVQKHFLWHKNPLKYDIFHMTLHSIWYNRVFQINAR